MYSLSYEVTGLVEQPILRKGEAEKRHLTSRVFDLLVDRSRPKDITSPSTAGQDNPLASEAIHERLHGSDSPKPTNFKPETHVGGFGSCWGH